MNPIKINLTGGDARTFEADVLVLKYAQYHYGLDEVVADLLQARGIRKSTLMPAPGAFSLLSGNGATAANQVLFLGVEMLRDFNYREIREFASRSLSTLAEQAPATRHIAATIHGAGYGLDEIEAFEAEVAGFVDGIQQGVYPKALERISIVERNPGRLRRLQEEFDKLLPEGQVMPEKAKRTRSITGDDRLRDAGVTSADKKHIFVAMPFKDDFDDIYHYGILGAVRKAGFLCERADLSSFVGDVMHWVKDRIESASLVIGEISEPNPNVFLEVGYAWGCKVPTVLITSDPDTLPFDVKGQRCLPYSSIRDLETKLETELRELSESGVF